VLWDPKNPKYYNKFAKNDAWTELAESIEADVEDCKKKMQSLLSSLRREKTKVSNSQRTGKGKQVHINNNEVGLYEFISLYSNNNFHLFSTK
jgi:hypothetical protein